MSLSDPGLPPHHGSDFNVLSLHLRECGQDTYDATTKRGGSIEGLHERDKVTIVRKEYVLQQDQSVLLRAGETVQFPNNHLFASTMLHVVHHFLDGGTIQGSSGKAGIHMDSIDCIIIGSTIAPETFLLLCHGVTFLRLLRSADTDIQIYNIVNVNRCHNNLQSFISIHAPTRGATTVAPVQPDITTADST